MTTHKTCHLESALTPSSTDWLKCLGLAYFLFPPHQLQEAAPPNRCHCNKIINATHFICQQILPYVAQRGSVNVIQKQIMKSKQNSFLLFLYFSSIITGQINARVHDKCRLLGISSLWKLSVYREEIGECLGEAALFYYKQSCVNKIPHHHTNAQLDDTHLTHCVADHDIHQHRSSWRAAGNGL